MMYFAAFLPDSFDNEYRRCIEMKENKMNKYTSYKAESEEKHFLSQ